jgi:hypothetical protein
MFNRSAYRALNENEFISKTVKSLGHKKQVFVHTYTLLKNLSNNQKLWRSAGVRQKLR